MDTKNFKVGQVWKTRGGEAVTVTLIGDDVNDSYPVLTDDGNSHALHGGVWFDLNMENTGDLIELVTDVADPAPAKKFVVGQVWKTRGGLVTTITKVITEPDTTYPVWANNEQSYTLDGSIVVDIVHDLDLLELVQDVDGPVPPAEYASQDAPPFADTGRQDFVEELILISFRQSLAVNADNIKRIVKLRDELVSGGAQ